MSGYIGNIPVPQATQTRDSFTCTAGQTVFATGGYTPQFLDVYLNGIFLNNGTDYTASNGSDVILTAAASADDTLEVVAYTTFEVANVTGADNFTVTGIFTSQGIDDNATSTAMTLDASGNLLVGTTDSQPFNNTSGTGFVVAHDGYFSVTRNGAVAYFNRNTSDGDIAEFRKDGSTVGSIGVSGDNLIIGSTDVGLLFNSGANEILPATTTNTSDATKNLGKSTTRFKDLYLSGGVYLGGTGSANKLDDYEEGTFSPMSSTKAIVYHARYTKIGNLVTINCCFNMKTGQSQDFIYLPFVPLNDGAGKNTATNDATNNRYSGSVSFFEASTPVTNLMLFHQGNQGAAAYFIAQNGNQEWPEAITDTEYNAVAVSFTYQTS